MTSQSHEWCDEALNTFAAKVDFWSTFGGVDIKPLVTSPFSTSPAANTAIVQFWPPSLWRDGERGARTALTQ